MDTNSAEARRRPRRIQRLLGFGFLIAMAMVMQPLSAAEHDPGFDQVTTTDGYKVVTLAFHGPIFGQWTPVANSSPVTYEATGDLTFTVSDGQIPGVSRSGDTYTLTFLNAVDPHTTVITVNGGSAYLADGESIPLADVAVPFSPKDLKALSGGLKALPGLRDVPDEVADMPFVRDWLADAELTITELIPGLADIPAEPATEAELLDALSALGRPAGGSAGDGIFADIAFDGRGVDVTFNPDATGRTFDMTGDAGVEQIDGVPFEVSLDGEIEVGVGLGGGVALDVTGGALTIEPSASDPEVVLSVDGTFAPAGRLGVVDVRAPGSRLDLDAAVQLELTCSSAAASCAPTALAAPTVAGPTGTATLTVDEIEIDFAGTPASFDASPLLELHWSDLGDLTNVTAPVDALGSTGVRGFTSVSVNDIAGGVQWIATWLAELETYGNLGAELPVVGGSAGELANLSASLSKPALAMGELLGLVGDLSAQDLLDLCDPDAIGTTIDGLALDAAEVQTLLPPIATSETASQQLARLKLLATGAATECESLLGGLAYDDTAHAITYEISFTADHELADLLGSSLDLGFAEAAGLEGLSLAVRGGDWSASNASVDFALTFGVKLGTYEDLGIGNGVTTTDFDGDGETDTVDTDKDADGLPERFTFAEGDRCRGLATLFGTSTKALQTHLGITAPTKKADGSVDQTEDALCDAALVSATDMKGWKIGGDVDGDPVNELTDVHVCAAAAARFGLSADDFISLNAPAVTTANCGSKVASGGTNGEYRYDDAIAMTPTAALPHRIYVAADDPLVAAELNIEGKGVGAHADLGILDLDVDVEKLLFEPSLTVGLVDPGVAEKADAKIDLWELANMADDDRLGELLDVDFEGDFVVKVDLYNAVVMPGGARGIDVYGDVADLEAGFTFHENRLAAAPAPDGKIHVGHDLDQLLNLRDISAAQAIRMIIGVIEQVAAMGDSGAMAVPIPFIDTTPQQMVDFARTFADVLERVEERNPDDISSLQAALDDALLAAGMADAGLTFNVTADELSLTFDGSRNITRSYPFVFDASAFPDLPFSIEPADGGATVTATAGVTFEPTIGIKFGSDVALEDRVFLRGAAPSFDVQIDASVSGSVHLGPVLAAIRGTAKVGGDGPELAVVFKDDTGAVETELTLRELSAIVKNPGSRIGVTFRGPLAAQLEVSATVAGIGTVRGTVTVDGDLGAPGSVNVRTTGFDGFDLKLDLSTFVNGSIASARFVGRTLEQSEAISGDLPFLGDELKSLATVGTDLRTVADEIDALWREYGEKPGGVTTFLDGIGAEIEGALCPAFDVIGECAITVELLDANGAKAGIATAHSFEIGLKLSKDEKKQIDLSGGLDLDVFQLGMDLKPELRYGYGLDVVLGVNLTDGFYLKPGGSMSTDFLQLYAGMDSPVSANVDLVGLSAEVAGGNVKIGGKLGPDTNNGGIAVGLVNGKTKLAMRDLTNRRTKIESIVAPRYDLDVKADLPVTLALEGVTKLTVPVHFSLQGSGLTAPVPKLILGCRSAINPEFCATDENITLDASSFVDAVLKPVLTDILGSSSYNPLAQKAIKDALDSEIPILDTKLRNLVREVAIATGQEAAWSLVEFLVDIGNMSFACGSDGPATGLGTTGCFDGQINLGWAEVIPNFVHHEPADWGIPKPLVDLIANLRKLSGATGLPAPAPAAAGTPSTTVGTTRPPPTKPGLAAGSMLSFPILEDPGSALKLVLGGELKEPVSFIEFRPPEVTLGKSINFSRTLFDLDIGFLKGGLTLALKGDLGLTLHVGFGYDSTGISTGNPLDGFYLIDHDGYEVALGGSIAGLIDGHFSVAGDIVSVRFRGSAGANLKAGLDLFDDSIALPRHSRNNGKLHLWEMGLINDAYPSPFCMFALGARFDANLAFSGKAKVLGITVFDKSWKGNWVLVDERLTCKPNEMPAHVDDNRRLVLNGGSFADFRFSTGEKAGDLQENFTVTKAGTKIRVSMTSNKHAAAVTKDFDPAEFDEIHAELGAGPNTVTIHDDVSLPATLIGGAQVDTLQGGSGDDFVDGAGGDDVVSGGRGADVVRGGDGDDTVSGDAGDDLLEGGAGSNTYVFGNAYGTDTIDDTGADATLDFSTVTTKLTGRGFYDEATVTTSGGSVTYWADEIMDLLGGTGDDDVELNRYYPEGFTIDLAAGGDTVTAKFSGIHRTIHVEDTGSNGDDELVVMGTAADNVFLFRGDGPGTGAATDGYIAMGARDFVAGEAELQADLVAAKLADPDLVEDVWRANYEQNQARIKLVPGLIDRVDYDNAMETITTKGVAGANHFYLDDAAAPLTIDGGDGGNTFQVGQIYRNARDEVRTRESYVSEADAPDHLSYGVSHPTTINGGRGNDQFTVYSNTGPLNLNGISGDNVFILRAFVLDGTVEAVGGDGNDRFEYVRNEQVVIDGGDGFNTMIIVGTPFSDGYILSDTGIDVCPLPAGSASTADPKQRLPIAGDGCAIDVSYQRIQSVVVHGLHGNDVFWVRASDAATHYQLYGGTDGATFYVQDPALGVTGVAGAVTIEGDFDPTFDVSLRKPVVLPGEDGEPALGTQRVTYEHQDDRLIVDAGVHTTNDVGSLVECTGDAACRPDSSRIIGLGMGDDANGFRDSMSIETEAGARHYPTGLVYHTIDELTVELGSGDDLFTVESTHTSTDLDDVPTITESTVRGGAGDDEIHVKSIHGASTIEGQDGDDTVEVGSDLPAHGGTLDPIAALLHVDGGSHSTAGDSLWLDDTGNTGDDTVTVTEDTVTGLGMADGITYTALEVLDIELGDHDEVANIQGTSATTDVHGNGGHEHFYVSSAATLTPGTRILGDTTASGTIATHLLAGHLDAVSGDLHVDAGTGRHLLMVSDRATTVGDAEVAITAGSISGLATGDIHYDADGDFADGISVWTSDLDDTIDVTGTRLDDDVRTISTLNTGTGADTVTAELGDDVDGLLVTNLESGPDHFTGTSSNRALVVFGGDGTDTIATGAANDIVFGDQGRVQYRDDEGLVVTELGHGGDGDFTDGEHRQIDRLLSVALCSGGADTIHTGGGDDIAYGGGDADIIDGEAGDDVLLGDHGEFQAEWMVPRHRSVAHDQSTADACTGGDTIFGGADDDELRGQQGADALYGNGTSAVAESTEDDAARRARLTGLGATGNNTLVGGHDAAGGIDEGDVLIGGLAGDDRIIGDNGYVDADDQEVVHDLACDDADTTVACTDVAGDDLIRGAGGTNRVHGGVGDDYIVGGAGFDHAEGGPGDDWVEGGLGDDDLIGGSSFERGTTGHGYTSGDDLIFGTAGENVILGDNGRIDRNTSADGYFSTAGQWLLTTDRSVTPFDIDMADADPRTAGRDLVAAGPGNSLVFGLGGDDHISGGGGGDHLEGNVGDDVVFGDRQFGLTVDADDGLISPLTSLPNLARRAGNHTGAGPTGLDFPGIHASILGLRDVDPLGATPWTAVGAVAGVEGLPGTPGPDDIIGGSSVAGLRDGDDLIYGDGSHDTVLGDNGQLIRQLTTTSPGAYKLWHKRYLDHNAPADAIMRAATRFDVNGIDAIHGRDWIDGGDGDDTVHGQDGNDEAWGAAGNDQLFGELGDDLLYGGSGDDVMLGDRGSVVTVHLTGDPTKDRIGSEVLQANQLTFNSPPFLSYQPYVSGRLHHRVDLLRDLDATLESFAPGALPHNGHDHGGHDLLRGGRDQDVLHGGYGQDLLNGDSGGDAVFAGDGNDALWGGIGHRTDDAVRGPQDLFVDILLGGRGEDLHDYTPRLGTDFYFETGSGGVVESPRAQGWLRATEGYWHSDIATADRTEGNAEESRRQHRQGTDWMFGGHGRDVFQGDRTGNGPNDGDRMIDWTGAFNLYTHCNSAYGGNNDLRSSSPAMIDFLERMSSSLGVGSLTEVTAKDTSGFRNLAMIYKGDMKTNSGKAHDGSPGSLFESVADCVGD